MLQSQRLILRKYTADDFDDLFQIFSDEETMQYYPDVFDEKRTQDWIDWNLQSYEQYGFGLWAVTLKEDGSFIGDCGITLQNIDGCQLAEIGYHINKKYQKNGYGREAAGAVLSWGFENTDFDCLYSYMNSKNIPSAKTASSVGMKKLKEYYNKRGTLNYVYGITREEYLSRQK